MRTHHIVIVNYDDRIEIIDKKNNRKTSFRYDEIFIVAREKKWIIQEVKQ